MIFNINQTNFVPTRIVTIKKKFIAEQTKFIFVPK